ncbi:hypothetical protein GCM10011491_32920 [Brucella endophytica]|uniref:ParB/Sulfiredoxin domain-containing protein n=1 Tax=Brucella endophytica TaxID=1963359 RepID=A0A916SIR9_9HYPH|nr:hypothetical protein [Brucella endophytica]GGB02219.1 hypothetical protein GCM10011491_32920 [Brucella endophytica]
MAIPSIGNYKKQKVAVANLQLDLENFRTGTVSDQTEALAALINRNANKIKGIITSIAQNGFLDLETPCVFPDPAKPGKFIVAEGNRRISSLKMLRTPTLAKNTPLMGEIKKIKEQYKTKIPTRIECAVFGNKKDCLAYILMRHGYGNDGASVIQWNSISKLRALAYVTGTAPQELRVLDFVAASDSLPQKMREVIDDDEINITNLARLTDDANVRRLLQIIGRDCINSTNGKAWILKIWQRVVEIIIDGEYKGEKFTVDKNINTTQQRQDFIKEIIAEFSLPNSSEGQATPYDGSAAANNLPSAEADDVGSTNDGTEASNSSNTSAASSGGSSKTSKVQPTNKRNSLIPKTFNAPGLSPQKVVNICDELKKLDIKAFRHCVGAMFRVFVEFGVETYIINNPIIKPKNDKLVSKIQAVIDHMQANNILTNKQLKPVRDIISKASHPISTETLNAYVHNAHVSPDSETLKTEWDNIQHFMELLWKK